MVRAHTGINLTRGTISSCAVAEGYSDCKVHGLVITARCDLHMTKRRYLTTYPSSALTTGSTETFFLTCAIVRNRIPSNSF